MPPPELLVLVGGTTDVHWFSTGGQEHARRFRELAQRHGLDLTRPTDIWDLGCGCGRIARWIAPEAIAAGGSFTGSDINRQLIDWAAAHLPGRYLRNGLRPPSPLPAASIDLVYAYSVLTHLREAAVSAWFKEVQRVLRPGGLALLTFHDEDYAAAWGPPGVVQRLDQQAFVVLNDALEGSNYLSSWLTRKHFTEMAAPYFDVLEIVPGQQTPPMQAVAILRSRSA